MSYELTHEDLKDATYYLMATKRFKKDFLLNGDAVVARAISVLKASELESMDDPRVSLDELIQLANIGMGESIKKMADVWRQSRLLKL